MPAPRGTYIIGGPMVFTGEQPDASVELYNAGAKWIGPNGTEVIERSGTSPNYVYTWVPKGGGGEDATARAAAAVAEAGAQEALGGVRTNSNRLDVVERQTEDIDIVSDGKGLVDAPADEAGIAIFAAGTTVGDGLIGGTRPLEAGDLTGYSWLQATDLGATNQAVIIRVEGTLGPLDYYLTAGGQELPVHSYRKVLSDDNWDYFYMGVFSGTRIEVQKRGDVTHTRYHGELGGRAEAQVESAIEAHEPGPSITVDPPVWGSDASRRTLFITLNNIENAPNLSSVDKVRLNLNGSIIPPLDWDFSFGARVLAFPITDTTILDNIASNIDLNDPEKTTLINYISFHATAGGAVNSGNETYRINFSMEAVSPDNVPTPGQTTVFSEHPRVFHALADSVSDPDVSGSFIIHFQPTEHGLVPVKNSLFTFTWNITPTTNITNYKISERGVAVADAITVNLTDRHSGGNFGMGGSLNSGTTYLARYSGSTVNVLGPLFDLSSEQILNLAKGIRVAGDRRKFLGTSADDENMLALLDAPAGGGGQSVFDTTRIGRGNFTTTAANTFATQSNSADITIPATGKWAIVNFGAWAANNQGSGEWYWIDLDVLRANIGTYGGDADASGATTGIIFPDAIARSGHDGTLAVTSARKLLFASSGASSAVPLEIRLVTPAELAHNLIIENPASPIAATADNHDRILYRAERLWRNEILHYTDPTATYRDFATTDLPAGYRWSGAVQVTPSPTGRPDNDVVYSIPAGHAQRKITGGGRAWWVNYVLPNWRGTANDQSGADQKIHAAGDSIFFGGKVQVAATYTARTPDQWHWVPLEKRRFEQVVGASPATLPEGSFEIAIKTNRGSNHWQSRFLLSQLTTANEGYHFREASGSGGRVLTIRYAPTTRQLTYSFDGGGDNEIRVIGEV